MRLRIVIGRTWTPTKQKWDHEWKTTVDWTSSSQRWIVPSISWERRQAKNLADVTADRQAFKNIKLRLADGGDWCRCCTDEPVKSNNHLRDASQKVWSGRTARWRKLGLWRVPRGNWSKERYFRLSMQQLQRERMRAEASKCRLFSYSISASRGKDTNETEKFTNCNRHTLNGFDVSNLKNSPTLFLVIFY